MNEITKADVHEAIRRLGIVCRMPDRATIDQLSGIWVGVLRGVSDRQLDNAVEAYLREGSSRFPPPSEIRKLALQTTGEKGAAPDTLRNRYFAWEDDHGEEGCPVCGAKLRDLNGKQRGIAAVTWGEKAGKLIPTADEEPPNEFRPGVLHDARKHRAKGIPWVGHSNEATAPAGLGERADHRLTEVLSR